MRAFVIDMSSRLYYQPMQQCDSYLDNKTYFNGSSQFCTLESSPSTHSFSSSGSPGSCITDNVNDFKHKLKELENVMLGLESNIIDTIKEIPGGDLKQVLVECAKLVSEDNPSVSETRILMDKVRKMVSVSGEPIQRLGAYMLEGLVARQASSGSSIFKALRCKKPKSSELFSYMNVLHEACPYFKFGYMSANGAIAEAMKYENKIHIIDFHISQGSQWITLIRAFATRRGGPPHIRITCVEEGESHSVGKMLSKLAKSFKVPFEFNAVTMPGFHIDSKTLRVRPGEAVAVNFAFMLHHMPDESVTTENHRDRLLRMVKGMNPKVVTLVEQESNSNTAAFFPRFVETLDYYTAMFESIDVNLPRDGKERINVEQHCLARDVVNIVACEGRERVERHELLGKWKSRFKMAGFSPCPLSPLVNSTIKTLLDSYCGSYRVQERDEALYLGWKNRDLVASCAWK